MKVGVCLIFSNLSVGLEKYITFFPQNFPLKTSVWLHVQHNPFNFMAKNVFICKDSKKKLRVFQMVLYKISSLKANINMLALLAFQ